VADVTSPFGFPYPEDDDFVRDGAQDIENLATGVNDYLTGGFLYAGTRYFFSNGSFAKADPLLTGDIGLRAIRVRVVGGGGAGGGADTTSASQTSRGGGGSGGGYAERFYTDIASLDASVTVTRGAGGTGVLANAGNNGAASEFGGAGDAWRTRATGGGGGNVNTSKDPQVVSFPNAPGVGSDGDVLGAGDIGGFGFSFALAGFRGQGGNGGGSFLGGGGRGGAANSGLAFAGTGIGGGGGGAYHEASIGTTLAGAAGSNGIVIVDCFV
jgi:hypothetical protein